MGYNFAYYIITLHACSFYEASALFCHIRKATLLTLLCFPWMLVNSTQAQLWLTMHLELGRPAYSYSTPQLWICFKQHSFNWPHQSIKPLTQFHSTSCWLQMSLHSVLAFKLIECHSLELLCIKVFNKWCFWENICEWTIEHLHLFSSLYPA